MASYAGDRALLAGACRSVNETLGLNGGADQCEAGGDEQMRELHFHIV